MLVLFFFLLLLPPVWLSWHVAKKRSWHPFWRFLLIVLLFLISQKYTLNKLFFGSLSGPDMPSWLLVGQAFALVWMVFWFLFVFFRDCVRFVLSRVGREKGRELENPGRRVFLAGMGTLATGVAIPLTGTFAGAGVSSGVAAPLLHSTTVAIPDLPPSLDGMKIVQLTDLHIGPLTGNTWITGLLDAVSQAKPDLICFTGDLSDGLPRYSTPDGATRAEIAAHLARLDAPLGVWACTGNHEYYSDYQGWMQLYREVGIEFLLDRAELLLRGGTPLVLAGRNDKQSVRFGGKAVPVDALFAKMPGKKDGAFRLLLDHRPERAEENARFADLQLSGHTHGGQCLGMEKLVARANQGLVRGWYTVSAMPLYVSAGAGLWSGFPVRLGIPAEVACITLRAA